MLEIVADGLPHLYGEVQTEAGRLVPPGLAWRNAKVGGHNGPIERMVVQGQRRVVRRQIRHYINSGLLERLEINGREYVRIKNERARQEK